ncbi:MAG TPA: hypothetical protein VFN13_08020 [Rudaea sp.]|nr:hypothetical protein [Rudaea sp.]
MADMTVTLRITADGKAAVQVIRDVEQAEQRMGASGRQAGEAAASGARQMTQSFNVAGKAALNVQAEINRARRFQDAPLYGAGMKFSGWVDRAAVARMAR